jgi:gluconokinase
VIVVVMGVAGCGKTTVGRDLARTLGVPFFDADDFHAPEAVAKMRAGTPLADADRWPWLDRLNALLRECDAAVLACSALRAVYRERIAAGLADVRWVYLRGSKALIAARLATRTGHYMNPALLDSQFATLEEPADALVADATESPEAIVARVRASLQLLLPAAAEARSMEGDSNSPREGAERAGGPTT